jgi:hypothetical protein
MKSTLLLIILALTGIHCQSQNNCDVLHAKEITWYGIDFSKSQMIGPDFNDPLAIKTHWFKSWNDIVLNEFEKYDLKKFFRKENIVYNVEEVTKMNQQVDENKLVTYNEGDAKSLQDSDIEAIINGFNFGKNEGYGVLMIVDNFNKYNEKGNFFVVFIDLKSKSILMNVKISEAAGGFGFRNYWAGAIYNSLVYCGKKYEDWEKAYCK